MNQKNKTKNEIYEVFKIFRLIFSVCNISFVHLMMKQMIVLKN